MKTVEERFWAKVQRGEGCWLWLGGKHKFGYGTFRAGKAVIGAHRYSWQLHSGQPIPEGSFVLHSCDNPPCVNPAHLRLGSPKDNMQDMSTRGRARGGGPPKDVCDRGHTDWYVNGKTGWKYCRPCRAQNSRDWRKRQAAKS